MIWPAQSSDLNPIESLWDTLQRQINSRLKKPTTLQELKEVLLEEWYKIPTTKLENFVESMPRRMLALKESKGMQTRY